MDTVIERLEVNLELAIIKDIDCEQMSATIRDSIVDVALHSTFSCVTSSTAFPTLLCLVMGSLSLLDLQRRVRESIASIASFPTWPLTFRMSHSHCFCDAVTASLICVRNDGREETKCWNNGVCESDVGGML